MSEHDCGNCVHCDDKLICDMTGKYVDIILLCPFDRELVGGSDDHTCYSCVSFDDMFCHEWHYCTAPNYGCQKWRDCKMSTNKNSEGYSDPTAYEALKSVEKNENRISDLVKVLRYVARNAGFEIDGRIVLVDRKTGEIWK